MKIWVKFFLHKTSSWNYFKFLSSLIYLDQKDLSNYNYGKIKNKNKTYFNNFQQTLPSKLDFKNLLMPKFRIDPILWTLILFPLIKHDNLIFIYFFFRQAWFSCYTTISRPNRHYMVITFFFPFIVFTQNIIFFFCLFYYLIEMLILIPMKRFWSG